MVSHLGKQQTMINIDPTFHYFWSLMLMLVLFQFLGELQSIKRDVPREKFEGSLDMLEEHFGRFKTHREIIRKVNTIVIHDF